MLRSFRPGEPLTGEFVQFGRKHRGQFPYIIQPFEGDELAQLTDIASRGQIHCWLSYTGQVPQGRIAAMVNDHIPFESGKLGQLGFFEVIEDQAVAFELFDAGSNWLRSRGCTHCWAPMNFSIWNSYRFAMDHFEEPPFLGEPKNPPWYPEFCSAYGFELIKHWDSWWVQKSELELIQEDFKAAYDLFLEAGYRFSLVTDEPADEYFPRVYKMSMDAFKEQLGYYPIGYGEFRKRFSSLSRVIDGNYSIFLRSPHHSYMGYVVCQKALSDAIRSMKGKKDILSVARYMVNSRKKGYANLSHAALLYNEKKAAWMDGQERFGKKLSPMAAAFYYIIERIRNSEYKGFMFTMMASDSRARTFARGHASSQRRYGLYQIELD